MFNSLRPHGSQHTRLPCPSQPPGVCSINVYYIKLCRVGHDLATEQQQHKKRIGSRPLRHESSLSSSVSSVLLGYCTRSSSETFWAFILFFKEGRFGWLISPRVIHLYRFLHLFGGHFFFNKMCSLYFQIPQILHIHQNLFAGNWIFHVSVVVSPQTFKFCVFSSPFFWIGLVNRVPFTVEFLPLKNTTETNT